MIAFFWESRTFRTPLIFGLHFLSLLMDIFQDKVQIMFFLHRRAVQQIRGLSVGDFFSVLVGELESIT